LTRRMALNVRARPSLTVDSGTDRHAQEVNWRCDAFYS